MTGPGYGSASQFWLLESTYQRLMGDVWQNNTIDGVQGALSNIICSFQMKTPIIFNIYCPPKIQIAIKLI